MRVSTFIPIIVGLSAGVFAVWVGIRLLKDAKGGDKPPAEVAVLVARNEIPYAVKVTKTMLASKMFGSFPVAGRFSKVDDLVGRVTATKIVQGTPILANMLAPVGTVEGAENQIPDGYRAEPVLVESYTVLDLDPGNRVDVMFSAKEFGGGRRGERTMRPILQDIEVFSVGDRRIGMEANTKPEKETKKSRRRSSGSDRTGGKTPVKLLVRTEDVAKLQMATMNGDIMLSRRAAGDRTVVEIPEEVEFTSATASGRRSSSRPKVPRAEAGPPRMEPVTLTVTIHDGKGEKPRKKTFQMGMKPVSPDPADGAEQSSLEATEPQKKRAIPD